MKKQAVLIFLGSFLTLGAFGGADCGRMEFGVVVFWSLLGLFLVGAAAAMEAKK